MSEWFTDSGVYINFGVIDRLLIANKKVDIINMIENPHFRISATDVSYRTVSALDSESLLPDHVQNIERGWRKFSIKDYVYLLVIRELKSFGVKNSQLKELNNIFYKHKSQKIQSSEAIACVLGHIEISLILYSDGKTVIADMDNAALWEAAKRPYDSFIKISINKWVNHALAGLPVVNKLGNLEANETSSERIMRLDLVSLSNKEREAIEIIRNGNYDSVTINKKENKPTTVITKNTLKDYSEQELTANQIVNMMKSKRFGDITIKKRDGRIVHVASEDSIKL